MVKGFVFIFLVELSTVIWCCVSFLILFQNYWSESAGSKVTKVRKSESAKKVRPGIEGYCKTTVRHGFRSSRHVVKRVYFWNGLCFLQFTLGTLYYNNFPSDTNHFVSETALNADNFISILLCSESRLYDYMILFNFIY